MSRLSRLAAFGLALASAVLAPGAAEAAWRWPVRGEVVGAFAYRASAPFAPGQRRGIDIAVRSGAPVRAACGGRVTFAGQVPAGAGRPRGLGVTVRCGRLAATHLRLARVLVRRGARVAAGASLGIAGPVGAIRLGARRSADRFGYLDPLELLGPEPPPAGGPGPFGAAPRGDGPGLSPAPARQRPSPAPALPLVAPRRSPADPPVQADHGFPALGWAGLALVAAGLPLGGLARARRRRQGRRRARPAGVPR